LLTHTRPPHSYGPRQGERKFGFTDTGRLNVEVAFTSFARPERLRQQQVRETDARCSSIQSRSRQPFRLGAPSSPQTPSQRPTLSTTHAVFAQRPTLSSHNDPRCLRITPTPQRAVEKELASCLAAALEPSVDLSKLPKSVVDIYILILEAGGGEAGAAATAASLALADAGIEMFDLVAACSVVSPVSSDGWFSDLPRLQPRSNVEGLEAWTG
jgi:ribonuclease PH